MSFGIGLGAFMEGVEGGIGLRQRIDQNKRQKIKDQRADAEYNRAVADRDQLRGIEAATQKQFQSEVAAGTADPGKFDEFWKKYALPRRKMALLEQGDVAGARALMEWGESDAALEGGRLFSSAMLKAQTGDAAGALADAIKAGQVKGYIDSGYELLSQDEIVRDGEVVGFRIKLKDANGREVEQDIATGDVAKVVSTFVNPDAAWTSQQAQAAEAAKRETDLEDYEKKKIIDKTHSTKNDGAEAYQKAREARAKNDLDFGDLSPEEQDAVVRRDLEAADNYARERDGGGAPTPGGSGQAAPVAPTPKIIVDETTGDVVQPAAAAETSEPVGLGSTPTPARKPQAEQPKQDRQYLIDDAAAHMSQGGNPEAIALRLRNAGIAVQEWPEKLKRAYSVNEPVGLGR